MNKYVKVLSLGLIAIVVTVAVLLLMVVLNVIDRDAMVSALTKSLIVIGIVIGAFVALMAITGANDKTK